jgi:hypothetical protein
VNVLNPLSRRSAALASILGVVAGCALSGCQGEVERGPRANLATAETVRTALLSGGAGGEAGKAAGPVGTGWGTIKGQFVFTENPPVMPPYDVTKEQNICTVDGKAPTQQTLVVDGATKGIKNVAVYLRDASRVHESAQPKTDAVLFDQQHCLFLTHMLGATVGQTLDIKNSDHTGHNTNILGSGFNQLIPEGATIPYKIQKEFPTPLEVRCTIHPWMISHLLTRKNGYYAVTNDKGEFEIANLPAGEPLEFQVWHERGAAAGKGLVGATPDAPDLKWSNRGRVVFTLKPDEVKEIKVVVPPSAFSS